MQYVKKISKLYMGLILSKTLLDYEIFEEHATINHKSEFRKEFESIVNDMKNEEKIFKNYKIDKFIVI